MKKIALFFLLNFLFLFSFSTPLQAQQLNLNGTFFCEWRDTTGLNTPFGNFCHTVTSCQPGYDAVLSNETACEEITSKALCEQISQRECLPPPYCNIHICRYGCSQDTREGGICNNCVPDTKSCNSSQDLMICSNDGSGPVLLEHCYDSALKPNGFCDPGSLTCQLESCPPNTRHCSQDGTKIIECGDGLTPRVSSSCLGDQICNPVSLTCVTQNQPPPTEKYRCTNTGCIRDDVNGNLSSGICQLECPTTSGGGVTPANIVNLGQVIDSLFDPAENSPFKFKFTSETKLGTIIAAALPFLFGIAGMILLLILIIGGYQYLLSAGDPKKAEAAKGTLTAAIIGFVLIICAYLLTQLMSSVFKLGSIFG